MVMYASKHQRLSDGFHDKNEARAYEMDKYPHKSRENSGDSRDRDRRNRERSVKESPHRIHSESSRNNSEKSYSSKPRSKAVYSSSGSSRPSNNQLPPKSNSYTSTPETERKLKELLARANEWTMHTSSSGKKYYYNCKTEVSQWEKPKEWIEKEALEKVIGGKLPVSGSQSNIKTTPNKDRGNDKHSIRPRSSQSSQQQPYRSQDRTSSSQSDSRSRQSSSSSHPSSQRRYTNSQSSQSSSSSRVNHTGQSENSRLYPSSSLRPSSERPAPERHATEHRNRPYEEDNGSSRRESVSSRLSAPAAENDSHYNELSPRLHPRLTEGNNGANDTGQVEGSRGSQSLQAAASMATDMYGRLKNLVNTGGNSTGKRDRNESPKVNSSTPSPHISTVSPLPTTSPKTRTPVQNQQQRWRKSSSRSPVGHNHSDTKEETPQKFSNPSPMSVASVSDLSSYPSPENSTSTPLSTFSSSQQPVETKPVENMEISETKDVEPPDKTVAPVAEVPVAEETKLVEEKVSTEISKNDTAKVITLAIPVEDVDLTSPETKPKEEELQFEEVVFSMESHSGFFSEDSIKDKINNPVDQLEKQAHLVQRDYYRLGFENYSQVMMDLKFARSLVRTTEIQANVQASRIVFLRQQVKELEKLKNENAYMT